MNNIIKIKNLSKKFGKNEIFNNLNIEFESNKKYAIKAPSGYGKSTLLNLISGFIYPDSGEIYILDELLSDESASELRKSMCMLPQLNSGLNDSSVYDIIMKPFSFKHNEKLKPEKETINELLQITGLEAKTTEEKYSKLSGGEKQRINLIICKLLKRKILLLDEPTSALDDKSTEKITKMLFDNSTTIIGASHDKHFLDKCDFVIDLKEMADGTD